MKKAVQTLHGRHKPPIMQIYTSSEPIGTGGIASKGIAWFAIWANQSRVNDSTYIGITRCIHNAYVGYTLTSLNEGDSRGDLCFHNPSTFICLHLFNFLIFSLVFLSLSKPTTKSIKPGIVRQCYFLPISNNTISANNLAAQSKP